MKNLLLFAASAVALTARSFAGADTEPMAHHDGKDMKDMKQMAPASTSDAGFYVAAFGGAQFDTQYGNERQTISFGGTNAEFHPHIGSHWGGVGGLKGGYNFESFPVANFMSLRLQPAVEAEGMYIGSDGDHSTGGAFGSVPVTQRFSTNSGDFFVNGILRFKNSSMITPYIGVGAGLQYFSMHSHTDGPDGVEITGVTSDDLDFAAQAIFGLDVAVTKHISIFSEYKFVDALGTDAKVDNIGGSNGITYRFKPDQIQQNLITAGVKYSF